MTTQAPFCTEHGPHTAYCGDPCEHDACNDAHPRPFGFYPAQRGSSRLWGEADDLTTARAGATRAATLEHTPYVITARHADIDGTVVESEVDYIEPLGAE